MLDKRRVVGHTDGMETIAQIGQAVQTVPPDHRGVGRVVQVTGSGMSVQVAWRGYPRSWHASYSLTEGRPDHAPGQIPNRQ